MARVRMIAVGMLASFALAANAGRVSVELLSADAAHGTVLFTVQNGESRPITVCLSNQLSAALPPDMREELAPFYLEKHVGHKWGVDIGTDVAFYDIGTIEPGQRKDFIAAMPERGQYRAVMNYADNTQLIVDCRALYSGKYSRAVSRPVDIPEHTRPDGAPAPKLIPRP